MKPWETISCNLPFLGKHHCNSSCECCLSMVNVANSANIHVRLCSFKGCKESRPRNCLDYTS